MLDSVHDSIFGGQQRHPHVLRGIVDQQQEVAPATGSHRQDGAAEIAVEELQRVLRAVLGFNREWGAAVLGDDAHVAEFADVVDRRQPAHHVVPGELTKRVKVEMAEALMPAPHLIILARGEAVQLGRIEGRM
jgi:hypothetical protein